MHTIKWTAKVLNGNGVTMEALVYDSLPDGWVIGGPMAVGPDWYVWIHEAKSRFAPEGRESGLMKEPPRETAPIKYAPKAPPAPAPLKKAGTRIDATVARRYNQLAREQVKTKLLSDVLIDMQICAIEGWDPREYVSDLTQTLGGLMSPRKDFL